MTNMEMLFREVDKLTPDERQQLREYIEQRDRLTWWVVPPENIQEFKEIMRPLQEDAATMTEEEINAVIDQAIAGVRHEEQQLKGGH